MRNANQCKQDQNTNTQTGFPFSLKNETNRIGRSVFPSKLFTETMILKKKSWLFHIIKMQYLFQTVFNAGKACEAFESHARNFNYTWMHWRIRNKNSCGSSDFFFSFPKKKRKRIYLKSDPMIARFSKSMDLHHLSTAFQPNILECQLL